MAVAASEIEFAAATEPISDWLDYRNLRHLLGLSPDQVAVGQRRRVFAVLPTSLAELGYGGPVVADVIKRARISRRTFYQLFDDQGDALRQCRDEGLQVLRRELDAFRARGDSEPGDVAAAAAAVALRLAADDPSRARLLLADPWVTGPYAAEGLETALTSLARLLGRRRAAQLSVREEGLFGGTRHLVLSRIYAARADTLPELAAPLADLIFATGPRRRRA